MATNNTTNYNLPIVVGTDKPSWLVEFDDAMTTLDSALKNIQDSIDALESGSSTGDIEAIKSDISTLKSSVSTMQGKVSSLEGSVSGLSSQMTDVQTFLQKLVNVVIVGSKTAGITATQYANLTTVSYPAAG